MKSEAIRFLFIGIINTIFYYALFSILIYVKFDYKLAVLFATIIGVLFSFKTFSKYVFNNKNYKLIFRFLLSYSILYFVNIYLIDMFIYLNEYIAGLIALIPITIFTYLLNKYFVFNKKPELYMEVNNDKN